VGNKTGICDPEFMRYSVCVFIGGIVSLCSRTCCIDVQTSFLHFSLGVLLLGVLSNKWLLPELIGAGSIRCSAAPGLLDFT